MKLHLIAALVALVACATSADAADISTTGRFIHDNDVQLVNFTVGATSIIGLRTWSYAGGVNAAGETITRGGFDPIVALFDSTGALIGEQDDAGCGKVSADAVTRQCWDISVAIELAAGSYTASIQQYNNYNAGPNLAEGFYYQGAQYQNFRNGFVDEMDVKRNGFWALDIVNLDPASQAVPEPASLGLFGLGMLGLTVLRRRGNSARP